MKIVSNKECYVQGYDLEFLTYDESISNENRVKASMILDGIDPSSYVSIKDKELLECILSNDSILDFAHYNGVKLGKLNYLMYKTHIDLLCLDDNKGRCDFEVYNIEKRKKEYFLQQLKDIIAYRKRESKCNFPNVPNPCLLPVTNDKLAASISLDFDNVLIYNLNGEVVTGEEDKKFCSMAYQILMHDWLCESDEKITLKSELSEDCKYLSITQKQLELQRKNKKRN